MVVQTEDTLQCQINLQVEIWSDLQNKDFQLKQSLEAQVWRESCICWGCLQNS